MSTGTKGGVGIRLFIAGADVVKRGFAEVADSGNKMWAQIAMGEKAANPAVVALSRASNEAQGAVQGLAGRVGGAAKVLGAFGAAGVAVAAALGAATLAVSQAREGMDFADKLKDQADLLGISTDRLQEYQYALRVTGGEAQQAGEAIASFREKFGLARAEYSEKAMKPFAALGWDADALKQFNGIEDALEAAINKIAGLHNESEQAAAAAKVGLTAMLPLIREGQGAFERLANEAHNLGVVMDSDLIDRAAEAHDEFETVSQVIDIQLKQAFVDLGPVLVDLLGMVGDVAKAISDLADSWRDLDSKSSAGLAKQINRLEGEKMDVFQAYEAYRKRPDANPNVIRNYLGSMNALDRQIGAAREELGGRPTTPAGATGDGGLRPQAPRSGGGARRAAPDTFTGALPAETLAAIADGRLTEAEARRLLAAVPDDARVIIVNTVDATKAETPEQIAERTKITDAFATPEQNPTQRDTPGAGRGPFGMGLMSPEDKDAWARDIGDATAQGLDAALHGDFTEFLKQQLYRAALEGLSSAVTDALKSVDFSGGGGGGGFFATAASFVASLFGGGRAGGGGVGSGMWVNAGEHGRTELAMIGGNGYVADHEATKRMIREAVGVGGGGGRLAVEVSVTADREGLTAHVASIARREARPIAQSAAMQAYGQSVQAATEAAPGSLAAWQAQKA